MSWAEFPILGGFLLENGLNGAWRLTSRRLRPTDSDHGSIFRGL